MVPNTGSTGFVSFTDGTSLPHAGCKVSIQAQVLRGEPMLWFRAIMRRIPAHWGEPKSVPGVNVFFSLCDRERRSVLRTLRRVRIHIIDPRLYYEILQSALEPILASGVTVQEFLSRLDRQQHIRRIQRIARRYVAENIVRDSPAERIKMHNEVLECLSGWRITSWFRGASTPSKAPQPPDVSTFEKRASSMVNQAASAVAKSASVFSEALQAFTDVSASAHARMSMMRSLSASRAFDKGEADALDFVRKQRSEVVAELSTVPWHILDQGELEEVDSSESHEIQAADIAGGIARDIWYRDGLVNVVRHFDFVLLNGMRLSERTAAEHQIVAPH